MYLIIADVGSFFAKNYQFFRKLLIGLYLIKTKGF